MTAKKRNDSAGTTTARGARRGRSTQRDDHFPRSQRDDDASDALHPAAEPHEHYRHEKARRQRSQAASADPLADAKREYKALLAAEAARGKGGRPRKNAAKPEAKSGAAAAAVDDVELEESELDVELDAEGSADEHEVDEDGAGAEGADAESSEDAKH